MGNVIDIPDNYKEIIDQMIKCEVCIRPEQIKKIDENIYNLLCPTNQAMIITIHKDKKQLHIEKCDKTIIDCDIHYVYELLSQGQIISLNGKKYESTQWNNYANL